MKFKLYNQNQAMLLPPSLVECLPPDHCCFIINDIVDHLDLSEIEKPYTEEGAPAYNPRMVIKIIFYAYTKGIRSSRKIEVAIDDSIALRYLAANQHLDHGTINLFRKNQLSKLPDIFAQIVILAAKLGLANFSSISVDGTKIKAAASKNNLMTKEEIAKLKAKIETFLSEAEKVDAEEDKEFGNKRGYDQIPEHLADPKTRKREIEKLQKKLTDIEEASQEIDRKQHQAEKLAKAEMNKTNSKTSNTTDPDSALMKMKDGSFKMAYNCQIVTANQFIAAYDVTTDPSDTHSLQSMVGQAEDNTKQKIDDAKADPAYFNQENITFLKDKKIEAFIPDTRKREDEKKDKENTASRFDRKNFEYHQKKDEFSCPEGKRLILKKKNKDGTKEYRGTQCHDCPFKSECTRGTARFITMNFKLDKLTKEMRFKLNTPEGKKKYAKRFGDVEPAFGNIKHNLGFTEFLCRGKEMALRELGLISTAHNLTKIFFGLKRKQIKRENINWESQMITQTT
jgi:transposase